MHSREKNASETRAGTELEVKILEVDADEVERKLKELGAKKILDALTRMEGFDFPVGKFSPIDLNKVPERLRSIIGKVQNISGGKNTLSSQNAYLRLREEGDKSELILKVAPQNQQSTVKEEEELTAEIESGEWQSVAELLQSLGLEKVIYQEKRRVSYTLSSLGVRFDIDTWPRVPTYLEIEGPSEEAIVKGINLLGFEKQQATSITGKQVFEQYGIDPTYLAFDKRTKNNER